jgi:hypothetical protein
LFRSESAGVFDDLVEVPIAAGSEAAPPPPASQVWFRHQECPKQEIEKPALNGWNLGEMKNQSHSEQGGRR